MRKIIKIWCFLAMAGALAGYQASATLLEIVVENQEGAGGMFFTPVWSSFHDGSFDVFDSGSAASMELESLATSLKHKAMISD